MWPIYDSIAYNTIEIYDLSVYYSQKRHFDMPLWLVIKFSSAWFYGGCPDGGPFFEIRVKRVHTVTQEDRQLRTKTDIYQ